MDRRTLKQNFCFVSRMLYQTLRAVDPGPIETSVSVTLDPAKDHGEVKASASAGDKQLFGINVQRRNGRIVFVR